MTLWTVTRQAPLSMEFFRQEYWSAWPFPPLGLFPTQGSNPHLLRLLQCRRVLSSLNHEGWAKLLKHIAPRLGPAGNSEGEKAGNKGRKFSISPTPPPPRRVHSKSNPRRCPFFRLLLLPFFRIPPIHPSASSVSPSSASQAVT